MMGFWGKDKQHLIISNHLTACLSIDSSWIQRYLLKSPSLQLLLDSQLQSVTVIETGWKEEEMICKKSDN